jgi:transposase
MENKLNLVDTVDSTQNNIFSCIIISLIVCSLFYLLLRNRTVEIEKFSNEKVMYSTIADERDPNSI